MRFLKAIGIAFALLACIVLFNAIVDAVIWLLGPVFGALAIVFILLVAITYGVLSALG